MKLNQDKLIRESERFLKRTEFYKDMRNMGYTDEDNFKLDCLLFKGSAYESGKIMAIASCDDENLWFDPRSHRCNCVGADLFDMDTDLFSLLENGYEIAAMSVNFHYCIWETMKEWQTEVQLQHTEGMNLYLGYCERHCITPEKLQDENVHYHGVEFLMPREQQTLKSRTGMKDKRKDTRER